ncbi:hypothetical protein [Conexibacter woesei]|uniref:hypothetical protein n=1 Tax=Conexibacter woesei TaxID=191495 RepID=UPI0012DD1B5F|nr:hypothetical protein [Conexibacter woesei]
MVNSPIASPPAAPWQSLGSTDPPIGYASYYLADELAALPVRAVTRIKDNKSDPNLETGTYGLFSTCQQKMRSGIVQTQPRYLFFVTRPRGQRRHLVGYYELGWYAPGSLSRRIADFALAARTVKFIEPVPLTALPPEVEPAMSARWRLNRRLDPEQTQTLLTFMRAAEDRTHDYLDEIARAERINLYYSGFRYPTWRREQPWSWADATRYLRDAPYDPKAPKIMNSSPTGWWRCADCGGFVENGALLKACPHCHVLDTLRAVSASEIPQEK